MAISCTAALKALTCLELGLNIVLKTLVLILFISLLPIFVSLLRARNFVDMDQERQPMSFSLQDEILEESSTTSIPSLPSSATTSLPSIPGTEKANSTPISTSSIGTAKEMNTGDPLANFFDQEDINTNGPSSGTLLLYPRIYKRKNTNRFLTLQREHTSMPDQLDNYRVLNMSYLTRMGKNEDYRRRVMDVQNLPIPVGSALDKQIVATLTAIQLAWAARLEEKEKADSTAQSGSGKTWYSQRRYAPYNQRR